MYNNYIIILSIVIGLYDFTSCYANTTSTGYIKGGNIFRGKVYFCILYTLFFLKIILKSKSKLFLFLKVIYKHPKVSHYNVQIILYPTQTSLS